MIENLWGVIARFLARPAVTDWLIRRALRTPYLHLEGYMERFWLLNSYESKWHIKWLPSIRLHHILRADSDQHLHNHPWTFRSIVLRGHYIELRDRRSGAFIRQPGNTYRLGADEFHQIRGVHPSGAWTLFITWRYQHRWGFKTEKGFVDYKTYLGIDE